MMRHGNLRLRSEDLKELKAMIDDREQVMKLRNKMANQLRAYKRRTDDLLTNTSDFLTEQLLVTEKVLKDRTKQVEKWIKKHKDEDRLIGSALGVRSVGAKTVAYCIAYIDLEKANHASSLWAYAGLDKPSHGRYTKGKAGGGNKTLRCALWNMADSQMKGSGAYRGVYDRTKERLSKSEKMVDSRNTQGKLVNVAWKDTKPSHRHGAALRAIMKHFLADYWFVGRTLLGLPTNPLYVQEKLGHTGIIKPTERGWKLKY
jgi:transposase